MDDPVQELFSNFSNIENRKSSNVEFECRFLLDNRKIPHYKMDGGSAELFIKKLISKYNDKPHEVSQTINLLCANDNIKQLVFIDGIQQKSKMSHYKKEKIINKFIVKDKRLNYKLDINYETPIDAFDISECTSARIKLRYSIFIGEWRIDITLINQVKSLSSPNELKTKKNMLLTKINPDNFIDEAPWDKCKYIELELEYTNDIKHLTVEKLNEGTSLIFDSLGISKPTNYIVRKLANSIGSKGDNIKKISNQVIELNKNIYLSELQDKINSYYITDKVDGERTILYIVDGKIHIINSSIIEIPTDIIGSYIIDTEMYKDVNETIYYIFDVLMFNNKLLVNETFDNRKMYFDKCINLSEELIIKEKSFVKITNIVKDLKTFNSKEKPYETDGYIFTPANEAYNKMRVYKYKPIEKLTCDFVIRECPKELLGIEPYIPGNKTLYILFCSIGEKTAYNLKIEKIKYYNKLFPNVSKNIPIQFTPSNKKDAYLYWGEPGLDNNVGEFRVPNYKDDISKYKWELVRLREDRKELLSAGKYWGNYHKFVEFNWMAYSDPLIIEELDTDVYFKKHDNDLQKYSRIYNSIVKGTLIDKISINSNVLDLASGKGQDLVRYVKQSINTLLLMEYDKTALLELINRKYSLEGKMNNPIKILTHQVDLNTDVKKITKSVEDLLIVDKNYFNYIFCNFAFHYFVGSKKSISNIVKLIKYYLSKNGKFVFTAFDGNAINELIKDKGKWESQIKNKYKIVKKYKNKKLEPYGQQIEVLLPFSDEKLYPEYLVNIDYISSVFLKEKIKLTSKKSFIDFINDKEFTEIRKKLDEDDKKYISLYHVYEFSL